MSHIMVDIETLSRESDAAVIAIGAVAFDPFDEDPIQEPGPGSWGGHFYRTIDWGTAMSLGSVEADTLKFWMLQPDESRLAVLDRDAAPTRAVMLEFEDWLRCNDAYMIWGHGATFDPVILSNLFKRLHIETPWDFRNVRDTRTLFDYTPGITSDQLWINVGPKHHALWDAYRQSIAVKVCLRRLRELADVEKNHQAIVNRVGPR